MTIAPELTQILITVGAVLGIVVVALLAVVPTLMEFPPPTGRPTSAHRDEVGREQPAGVDRQQPQRPVRLATSVGR